MIYDLMPKWMRRLLKMDGAALPTDRWTWRHTCRYGSDPGDILRGYKPEGLSSGPPSA